MAQESIWAGSSTFATGSTPWGLYDTDSSFSTDVEIEGNKINKGTYSIFSIPNENNWDFIKPVDCKN